MTTRVTRARKAPVRKRAAPKKAAAKKLGRPSSYKPEYCILIVEKMSEGFSKEACAGLIGCSKQRIYDWAEKHQAFRDAVKEGEAKSRAFWEELGIKGARGKISGFNATAWIFNMKNRFDWRDKSEYTGEGGGPFKADVTITFVDAKK